MRIKEIQFMGVLTNVDDSILHLNELLEKGFKVEKMNINKFDVFMSHLNGYGLDMDHHCVDRSSIFVIQNSIPANLKDDDMKYLSMLIIKFTKETIHNYLNPLIKAMRLFKDGNIRVSSNYFYYYEKNTPKGLGGYTSRLPFIFTNKFKLEKNEIPNLKKFLDEIELPFKNELLELAFENFETSYEVYNRNLQFLSLMNGFEVLFHPSNRGELRYRISRNVAVLLGKDLDDSQTVFKNMKTFYDKRSDIVHRGKSNITDKDTQLLRNYLRESIKIIFKSGKKKDDILTLLNLSGFGENPLRH